MRKFNLFLEELKVCKTMFEKKEINNSGNQKTLKQEDDFIAVFKCIFNIVAKQIVFLDIY